MKKIKLLYLLPLSILIASCGRTVKNSSVSNPNSTTESESSIPGSSNPINSDLSSYSSNSSENNSKSNSSYSSAYSSSSSSSSSSSIRKIVRVESVEFKKDYIEINSGETVKLEYTIYPEDADNKEVTFQNKNPDIIQLSDDGVVKGLKKGNAKVTITTGDGNKTDECEIKVLTDPLTQTVISQLYEDYSLHSYNNMGYTPSLGNPKLLIVPVWFTDSNKYITSDVKKENVRNDIIASYLGTNEQTGWRSVKTYYEELSQGRCKLNGTVTDWYSINKASTSFYSESQGFYATDSLIKSAADWYFTNNPNDSRSNYDTNGDGWLDGVIVIYGAPDYASMGNGNAGNMWAYTYHVNTNVNRSTIQNPIPNPFFWASYDFMYDSDTARYRAGSRYGTGDNSNCDIDSHTFIHEMGHMFGLDDYYDYGVGYSPAGTFSMQDHNIGSHDPYSAMALGWSDPYVPEDSCELTIKDFQSSKELILLTPNWNKYSSPFDEYLLLELYSNTGLNEFDCAHSYGGYPTGPKGVGIRLWHVDSRLTYVVNNQYLSETLTTNANKTDCMLAFSNTYPNSQANAGYGSVLGEDYYEYNLNQLIRNNVSESHKTRSTLKYSDLFKVNESFSMATYKSQFIKSTKLNSGLDLGWTFKVTDINDTKGNISATIKLTKTTLDPKIITK